MCLWAGVSCDMEVYNLFQGSICQAGLSRLDRHQQRQGLVPYLRVTVPPLTAAGHWRGEAREDDGDDEEGPATPAAVWAGRVARVSPMLHELKCISSNGTCYKPTWTERAVDVRAGKLQEEYREKAATADKTHNGVEEDNVGPCEQRLVDLGEVRCLVAGNLGEVSDHWHQLLASLATNRVRVSGVQRGDVASSGVKRQSEQWPSPG